MSQWFLLKGAAVLKVLKCLPLPMTVIGLCCSWYIWAQTWELDKVKLGSLSSWLRKLYDFFFLIVVCLSQNLHRCDLLDFRTELNCFTNANVRSKTSWSKQKSFSWLWWLWSRFAVCAYVFKVVYGLLSVCAGERKKETFVQPLALTLKCWLCVIDSGVYLNCLI